MHVNEVKYFDAIPIDSYGPGFFRIEGKILKSGIVCSRSGVYSWKGYKDLNILEELQYKIDVLFVGTGNEICQVPESFRKRLQEIDLALEIMSTPSACRTYNVLLSEGRRIAIAALPVDER
tara:strand:- start:227 stop:589 length:363 start_codon:yes stop_codon:yes gene_type:complete